ncbi:MAG TPA: ABC transporter permease [Gaiellaceae bacterium]|jgi:ABC-2 type transport system permease protein|nr:ABC transporter permease [Gaiellaceae bacterium]
MSDVLILSGRCLRLSRRQLDALMTAVLLPVILMVTFVELFGGAIHTGGKYVTYVVPGVLILCAGFGSALTAVSVCQDARGGIVDRFRAMDVNGAALLGGHVVASVVRNAVSTALVIGIAFALGFRPHAGALNWVAAVAILLAFVAAVSWFAAVLGLLASSPEAANGWTFLIVFLPYASSAFVPADTMPHWLQGFARHQPITPLTETLRGLLLGTPIGSDAWIALAWCAGILTLSVAAAAALFARRTD